MELKVSIGYEELLALIQQLPKEQILSLKRELEKFGREKSSTQTNKLKQLVLSGPQMSETQYNLFLEFRREMNQWREG